MNELNGKEIGGSHIEVSLAKPPSDKKKKEEMLRARERRMMQMFQGRSGYVYYSIQLLIVIYLLSSFFQMIMKFSVAEVLHRIQV